MIKFLVLFICVLLTVAFFTLLERKILGFSQFRKGPNLTGVVGLLQPFSDGLKLLTKEDSKRFFKRLSINISPPLFFLSGLIVWSSILESSNLFFRNFFLFFLLFRRLGALLVFFAGWGGGRRFSLLGGGVFELQHK